MDIVIHKVSAREYHKKIKLYLDKLPLWLSPEYIGFYPETFILLAMRGVALKGVWVVPMINKENQKIAKREYRFFPYASPIIFADDNLQRRMIVMKLYKYLINKCDAVSLPMHPGFNDLSVIQSFGAFVEWRHTHLLSKPLTLNQVGSRLRNHITYSQRNVEIFIDDNPDNFNFDLAIKGGGEEREKRKLLAIKLLKNKQAEVIYAKDGQRICAGVLIVYDNSCSYMLHNWQDEKTPRGTISSLIFEATNRALQIRKLTKFDFEGSVFYNVDYFFTGFNTEITPYGYIHWSSNKKDLFDLIDKSLNISGRLYSGDKGDKIKT